ncbi:MAG: HEAT repeat domain-containing protein [Terriglobia bacterium]
MLIEDIVTIVVWVILSVVALVAGMALLSVQRRVTRRRYFQHLDEARHRVQELLDPLYENSSSAEAAVAALQVLRRSEEQRALEEALLRHARVRNDLPLTREIAKRLGWIDQWSQVLRSRAPQPTGTTAAMLTELGDDYRPPNLLRRLVLRARTSFFERCRAADKLGQIPTPQGMWALLVGATDPHPEVQEVCLRHLGQLADPATLPVLIEELIEVLEGRSAQSVRNIKTALVQFRLEDVGAFLGALQHSNRRVRFFATDIIREIAERHAKTAVLGKNDFSPEIYRLFAERFYRDDWPDVRARAAVVIAQFHDDAAAAILRKLLEDEAWFVRMHATRAAADKMYLPLAPDVVQRLTDSNWLVRESAAKTLTQMGNMGVDFVLEAFINSQDRYANEQICEELQRGGLLIAMLDSLPAGGTRAALTDSALLGGITLSPEEERRAIAIQVVRKMVSVGKITMLLMLLRGPIRADVKLLVLRALGNCYTPDCLETFQICAETDPDPQVREVALASFQAALEQATEAALAAESTGD